MKSLFRIRRKNLVNFKRFVQVFSTYKRQLILGTASALAVSLLNLIGIGAFAPLIDLLSIGGEDKISEHQEVGNAQSDVGISGDQNQSGLFALDEKSVKIISDCEQVPFFSAFGHCILYPFKYIQQELFSFFQRKSQQDQFLILGSVIVVANLLKICFLLITVYLVGLAVQKVTRDLRYLSFRRLLHLPLGYFQRRHTGTLINRVVGDSENISMVLGAEFAELFVNLFYISTHLIFLLAISWKTLLLLMVIAFFLNQPTLRFFKKVSEITKQKLEQLGVLSAATYEMVSGVRIIRSFGKETDTMQRYQKLTESVADQSLRGHYYSAVGPSLVELGSTLIFLLFLMIGSQLISHQGEDGFTHGTLFAFLFGLLFILGPLKRLSVSINSLNISMKVIERIFKFVGQPKDAMYRFEPKDFRQIFPKNFISYQLNCVSGGHDSRRRSNVVPLGKKSKKLAIRKISMDIRNGEKIGLVGRSGAGKSTLIDMMIGFLSPASGEVFFSLNKEQSEKRKLTDISLGERATALSAVFQEPFLFHATIRENITYFLHSSSLSSSKRKISNAELDEAARNAVMYDVIQNLPLQYDTTVGERGLELSGGQCQRIVLMRAFLQKPSVLFMDEATSHLDLQTEKKILKNLQHSLPETTVIISSHRLESIRTFADRFFVLEDGELIEEGSHEELLARQGIYCELHSQQSG